MYIYICLYVHIYTHTWIYIYVYMYIFIYIHEYTCISVCMTNQNTLLSIHVHCFYFLSYFHQYCWSCMCLYDFAPQKNPATSGNSEKLRLREDLVGIIRVKAIEHLDLERSHHKMVAILMRKFVESLIFLVI